MSGESDIDFGLDFKPAPERLKGDRQERIERSKRLIRFNVSFLDDLLLGIAPHDLVIIGARTGAGKTELATGIAKTNAADGFRVFYFALEGEPGEVELRTKFSLIMGRAWQEATREHNRIARPGLNTVTFRRWYLGVCEDIVGDLDEWANKVMARLFSKLHTYYRGKDFKAADLERNFKAIQDQADLIVLDHLHYVDSDDSNENRAFKNITKTVRDASLSIGIPVICIAHLRKSDKKSSEVVPDIEEFHGSSDIGKISTVAVTLAKAGSSPPGRPEISQTYMYVGKERMDGATRYAALMGFNRTTKLYENEYTLGRLGPGNASWEPLGVDDRKPFWAGRAVSP